MHFVIVVVVAKERPWKPKAFIIASYCKSQVAVAVTGNHWASIACLVDFTAAAIKDFQNCTREEFKVEDWAYTSKIKQGITATIEYIKVAITVNLALGWC